MASGVKRLVLAASKGKTQPTNEQLKAKGTNSQKAPAPKKK